jgi:hypothetical protein
MHQHLIAVVFNLKKAYDTTWRYSIMSYPHRESERASNRATEEDHVMRPPRSVHIHVNCSLRTSVTGVQKCGDPSCWKTYQPLTCGMLRCTVYVIVFHGRRMVRSLQQWLIRTTRSVSCYPIHASSYHWDSEISKCDNYGG